MKKFLPVFLAFFLSLGCATRSMAPPLTSPDLIHKTMLSVVQVGIQRPDGQAGICTGFVVNSAKGQALTASHCLPEGSQIYVNGIPSSILKQDDALALVSLPTMLFPVLDLAEEMPEVADKTYAFGFANGYPKVTVIVRDVAIIFLEKMDFATNGPYIDGMSGGPVVNQVGKVVGMVEGSTIDKAAGILHGPLEMQEFLKGT